jgi:Na+/proline symporter
MSIEVVTIIVYLLLMLVIGMVVQRMNKDVSDYFRNGCRGQWWLVGASAFMTMFSAWTFTGAAGVAFTAGWSAMIIFIANFIGFMLNFMFLAPWFRQLRATTAPEVIRDRFGFSTQQFYAWASIPTGLFYASLHLYGLAIFSSSVFGLPINAVIIGVGLVVLIYATTGGSWAVMSSDFLQFLILMPMTLLLAFLALKACGGIEGFFDLVKEKNLNTEFQIINSPEQFEGAKFSWLWAIAISTQLIFGANTLNSAPRYFAVKDGREARKAALLAAIMMLLGSVIWFIPPMVGRLLFEDQINAVDITTPAEAAYAITSMKLLPLGMTGLMVVAMFSATMSSMDSDFHQGHLPRMVQTPKQNTTGRQGTFTTWASVFVDHGRGDYLPGKLLCQQQHQRHFRDHEQHRRIAWYPHGSANHARHLHPTRPMVERDFLSQLCVVCLCV